MDKDYTRAGKSMGERGGPHNFALRQRSHHIAGNKPFHHRIIACPSARMGQDQGQIERHRRKLGLSLCAPGFRQVCLYRLDMKYTIQALR